MTNDARENVLIVGGGVAALEALLALRARAGEAPRITLLAPDREFILRASAVLEPFARGHARRIPLRTIVESQSAQLVPAALARVDAERQVVVTADGCQVITLFPAEELMITNAY